MCQTLKIGVYQPTTLALYYHKIRPNVTLSTPNLLCYHISGIGTVMVIKFKNYLDLTVSMPNMNQIHTDQNYANITKYVSVLELFWLVILSTRRNGGS